MNANAARTEEYFKFILPHITYKRISGYFKYKCIINEEQIKFIFNYHTSQISEFEATLKCKCKINEGYIKFILPHIKDEWIWGQYECKSKKNSKINEVLLALSPDAKTIWRGGNRPFRDTTFLFLFFVFCFFCFFVFFYERFDRLKTGKLFTVEFVHKHGKKNVKRRELYSSNLLLMQWLSKKWKKVLQ